MSIAKFKLGHHYQELDSLRGLAAITVMMTHFLNLVLATKSGPYVEAGHAVDFLMKTPLFALFAGHESVMLFFVLSGFVLSLQFLNAASRGREVAYTPFAIKRIFRIYVPYLFALALAVACCASLYHGPITDLSDWFNSPWSEGITGRSLLEHLAFLGNFKSDRFDPVLWSLVHEMRISLIFPFLAVFLMKRGWRTNLTIAFILSFFGITATLALLKFRIDVDYFLTIHYISMFIFGFLLAQNINVISDWYSGLKSPFRIGFALAGFCMYTFAHLLPGRLHYYSDVIIAIGATQLVIVGVCSTRTSAFLNLGVVKFFGNISYSLYLYHAVMLLAFTHALYGQLPLPAILAIAMPAAVLVSWLSYRYIELPAIKAGKTVSASVARSPVV